MCLFTVEFSLWSALFIWLNPSQHSSQVALNSQDQRQQLLCLPSSSSAIVPQQGQDTWFTLFTGISAEKCGFEAVLTPVFILVWCLRSTVHDFCFSWSSSEMGPQMSPVPLPSESTNQVSHKISEVQPALSE